MIRGVYSTKAKCPQRGLIELRVTRESLRWLKKDSAGFGRIGGGLAEKVSIVFDKQYRVPEAIATKDEITITLPSGYFSNGFERRPEIPVQLEYNNPRLSERMQRRFIRFVPYERVK
jgi:hypothetical protein